MIDHLQTQIRCITHSLHLSVLTASKDLQTSAHSPVKFFRPHSRVKFAILGNAYKGHPPLSLSEQTIIFDKFSGYLAQTCSPLLSTHVLSFHVDLGDESCRSRRRLLVSPAQRECVCVCFAPFG